MIERAIEEESFFMDDNGSFAYCEICQSCDRECKQSFRVISIYCPYYEGTNESKTEEGGE